jgi:hypothetical protein
MSVRVERVRTTRFMVETVSIALVHVTRRDICRCHSVGITRRKLLNEK